MTRSRQDKWISGVCAGIANQLGIGKFWVRLLFVIAAVVIPGVSLIGMLALYILLAVIMPWDDRASRSRY